MKPAQSQPLITLHRITPQLTDRYKVIRLRALHDSPMAFGSTFTRESAFSGDDWAQRARNLDDHQAVGYIAVAAGADCGIAVCFLNQANPACANLFSMWVAPEARRAGIGELLVREICAWATKRKATHLALMVTSSNSGAAKFYERLGFTKTGRTEPYPNDASMIEHELIRPIP